MLLSLHVLQDLLAPLGFVGALTSAWDAPGCSHPLMCDGPCETFEEGPLYVVRGRDLPKVPATHGHPSLLVVGAPPASWATASCDLLWTERDVSLQEVANVVSAEFARLQAWTERMQESVDGDSSAREFANTAEGIFQNPIYALGPEMYVICSYSPQPDHDTERYATYREKYHMPFGAYEGPEVVVDKLTMDDYFEEAPVDRPTITWSPFGHEVLYHTVFQDGEPLATVSVDAIVAPITDRDRVLSVVWGSYLRKLLLGKAGRTLRQTRAYGYVFHGLLDHVLQPERSLQGLLRLHGWQDGDRFMLCVLRNNASQDEVLAERLAQSVVRNVGEACSEVREGCAVVVFDLTRLELDEETFAKRLMALTRDKEVTVSCSRPFEGFRNLWYYYQQAKSAEELGTDIDPELWFYRYDDYALADMQRRITKGTLSEAFVPEGLKRLMRHDRDRNGVYVPTLRTYLDCERNVAETSRRLFVHRNTFLYRLDRIEKLLDMDLDDADTRLMLQMALRLL